MSTKEQESVRESDERDENNVSHMYFDRTLPQDWKLGDALQYYLQQNVSKTTVFDLVEESLKKCMEVRESLKNRCLSLMKELEVLKEVLSDLVH